MKKYILFDNDGVLVETENWYFEANKKALKELGLNLYLDEYLKIMARGGTAWEIAQRENIPQNIIDKQRFKRDIYYEEFITTKDIEIPNVKKTLEKLSKKYKMAIVTTSRRVDFELIHKNKGITNFMDFILCVEDYKRAKPYPDPYLKAVEKFNAKKKECLIIEDSQRGLSSALNANIDCAVIYNEFTKTHDFSKANYFLKKFEDLENLLLN